MPCYGLLACATIADGRVCSLCSPVVVARLVCNSVSALEDASHMMCDYDLAFGPTSCDVEPRVITDG